MDKILEFTLSQKSIYDYLIKYAHPYFKVFRDLRKEVDKYYDEIDIKEGVPNDIEDIYHQIKDKQHVPYKLSLKVASLNYLINDYLNYNYIYYLPLMSFGVFFYPAVTHLSVDIYLLSKFFFMYRDFSHIKKNGTLEPSNTQYNSFTNNLINKLLLFFNVVGPSIHSVARAAEKTEEVHLTKSLSQSIREDPKKITSGKDNFF